MAANQEQIDYWNGQAAQVWTAFADRLDAMLEPLGRAAMAQLEPQPGERILDIGCGAGATSLALAEALGAEGLVVGVDVSEPLTGLARARAGEDARVRFHTADASAADLEEAPFDAAFSRFGVMFFEDPAAAFTRLRAQLKPGGRLAFICWRPLFENSWALAPLEAALPLLPKTPEAPDPNAPGPFAFADSGRVETILSEAGWSSIGVLPWDGLMTLPGEDSAEAAEFALEVGPLARLIREQGADLDEVRAALIERLAQNAGSDGRVRLSGAAWIVTARAP